jgi:hypothetical protein
MRITALRAVLALALVALLAVLVTRMWPRLPQASADIVTESVAVSPARQVTLAELPATVCDGVLAQASTMPLRPSPFVLTPAQPRIPLTETLRVADWADAPLGLIGVRAPLGAARERIVALDGNGAERLLLERNSSAILPGWVRARGAVVVTEPDTPQQVRATVLDQTGATIMTRSEAASSIDQAFAAGNQIGAIHSRPDGLLVVRHDAQSTEALLRVDGPAVAAVRPSGDILALDSGRALRLITVGAASDCLLALPDSATGEADDSQTYALHWSKDGRFLAVLQASSTLPSPTRIVLWDSASGQIRRVTSELPVAVTAMLWRPGSSSAVLAGIDLNSADAASGMETLWQLDAEQATLIALPSAPLFSPGYWGLAFSPDGTRLAISCPAVSRESGLVGEAGLCLFEVR